MDREPGTLFHGRRCSGGRIDAGLLDGWVGAHGFDFLFLVLFRKCVVYKEIRP